MNVNKKIGLFILFLPLVLFFGIPTLVYAQFSCSVKGSCAVDETEIFKMSDLTNAHAGTPASSYSNVVCCSGVEGLGNSCSGNYEIVLRLSSPDNAHVEDAGNTNYGTLVCLSSSGNVDCVYSYSNANCPADYTCLASVSSTDNLFTNAHVGDCSAYTNKVCCKVPSYCTLEANPSEGIGPFSSTLTATFFNLPPGVTQANISCDQSDAGTLEVLVGNQATKTCNYPAVISPAIYVAFSNISLANCTTTINDYDPSTINFDAWLGITNAAFMVGQPFPVNVYVKNKGTQVDSYMVLPMPTANLQARIYDNVIDNVTPGRVEKTEFEIIPRVITANEQMNVMINSTRVPTYGKLLTLTISSGMPSLADIDVFSIFQIIVLSLLVLLLSKRLVRVS